MRRVRPRRRSGAWWSSWPESTGAKPPEPASLPLEPGRRVSRDLLLIEVGALLARRTGRDGHAPTVAGGLGRAFPMGLSQQCVERRDVRLDRGRDDVRAAGLPRVLAAPPLAADVGRGDPDRDRADRVGPL